MRGDVERARTLEARTRARLDANPLLARQRWETALGTSELELARGDIAAAEREIVLLLETIAQVPLKAAVVGQVAALDRDARRPWPHHGRAGCRRYLSTAASGDRYPWLAAEADRARRSSLPRRARSSAHVPCRTPLSRRAHRAAYPPITMGERC